MRPQHKNPTQPRWDRENNEIWASAPYNFVPLPEKIVPDVASPDDLPDHDTWANSKFHNTGYFDVTLTTHTPLYVRSGLTEEEFKQAQDEIEHSETITNFRNAKKNKPDFFHTRRLDEPFIPGSSLRGMLRNVLEIVSYSKLTRVADRQLVYRSVGDRTALGAWYRQQMLGDNQANPPALRLDYPSPRLNGGYLCRDADGDWAIQPAQTDDFGNSFVHVEYDAIEARLGDRGRQRCHPVWVKPAPRTCPPRGGNLTLNLAVTAYTELRMAGTPPSMTGLRAAILVESGHMGNPMGRPPRAHQKHMHCAIYETDETKNPIKISSSLWNTYVADRDMNRGIKTRPLKNVGDALFYLLNDKNELVFFGPTMMFRLPYQHTINDLIPFQLREASCVDFAEALFGYVRDNPKPEQKGKARSYASRVYVTDALLNGPITPDKLWLMGNANTVLTPRILATPKPTAFQHYLVQPDEERANLSHYDSPTRDENGVERGHRTEIRGHKLYWHRGERGVDVLRAKHPDEPRGENEDPVDPHAHTEFMFVNGTWQVKPSSKQHTQFKPVASGVKFKFRVYFENQSDAELGALTWTLMPLGNVNQVYCHSLGMGKALGMGAVNLEAKLTMTNRFTRYKKLFNERQWQTGIEAVNQLPLSTRETLEQYVKPFEDHVLESLGVASRCQHLYQLKRIGTLLELLKWENQPNPDHTRTQLSNVFRERPVLPDPAKYAPALAQLIIPMIPENESKPLKQYLVGEVFVGQVVRKYEDGSLLVKVPNWVLAEGYAVIYAKDLGNKPWAVNAKVRCEILQVAKDQHGKNLLVCKPAPKQANNPK